MKKARKFKKSLAPNKRQRKIESVLSVELIGKEYFLKINGLWKNIISRIKSLKLAN